MGFGVAANNEPGFTATLSSGITLLSVPAGWLNEVGLGIKSSGQVTGYANFANAPSMPFIGSPSGLVAVAGPVGWGTTLGQAINDSGQITGTALNGSAQQAFIGTSAGTVLVPLPSGWANTNALSINNSGAIAGDVFNVYNGNPECTQSPGGLAFVGTVSDSTVIPLPPGATCASVNGNSISNSGAVVGTSLDPPTPGALTERAWIWSLDGGTQILNAFVPAGWNIEQALSISANSGIILAGGTYNGGRFEYLELISTAAEPSTVALCGLSSASLLLFFGRKLSSERRSGKLAQIS